MGGAGLAEGDGFLEAQEPADYDGPVGPRAGPRRDQAVPPGLNWPARFAVRCRAFRRG